MYLVEQADDDQDGMVISYNTDISFFVNLFVYFSCHCQKFLITAVSSLEAEQLISYLIIWGMLYTGSYKLNSFVEFVLDSITPSSYYLLLYILSTIV